MRPRREPIRCFTHPLVANRYGDKRATYLRESSIILHVQVSRRLLVTSTSTSLWRIASQAIRDPPATPCAGDRVSPVAQQHAVTLSSHAVCDVAASRRATSRCRYQHGVCSSVSRRRLSHDLSTTSHGFIPFVRATEFCRILTQESNVRTSLLCPLNTFCCAPAPFVRVDQLAIGHAGK